MEKNKQYIQNFNELSNINSEQYKETIKYLTETGNMNHPKFEELYLLAKDKGLI